MISPELEHLAPIGKPKRVQTLAHTLGLQPATWRALAKRHEWRNRSEYEGVFDVDDRLLSEIIAAARALLAAVYAFRPPKPQA